MNTDVYVPTSTTPKIMVAVKLWMPSMGHGSSPVKLDHAKDAGHADVPGVFEVTHVYFVMPGDWEIHVQLKNGPKVIEDAIEALHI